MGINKNLLEIICCPICKGSLKEEKNGKFLVCEACKIKYPIKEGIPVLIAEEGIRIEQNKN